MVREVQCVDEACSDMMPDLLVTWRGASTAFEQKCLKYTNEAKLLFKEKGWSREHTYNNFRKSLRRGEGDATDERHR